MMITKMSLPRRTFLRGVGAAVALPFLDAMVPALSAAAKAAAAAARLHLRLAERHHPEGFVPDDGRRRLRAVAHPQPLAPVRDQLLVLSGLAHRQADSFGDGNGDHARGTAVWLSGVHAWDRRGGGGGDRSRWG